MTNKRPRWHRPSGHCDFRIESLEARQLLATFTVTSLSDGEVSAGGDQPGTLRQAIFDANANPGADTIEFDFSGGVIGLREGGLSITDELTINGLGESSLIISGQGRSAILEISDTSVEVNNVSMINGYSSNSGGAVAALNSVLTLSDVIISGSTSFDEGGAIFGDETSTVTLNRTRLVGNRANRAGGIRASNMDIADSTVTGNRADSFAGGVFASGSLSLNRTSVVGNGSVGSGGGLLVTGGAQIANSTISGNSASTGGGIYGRPVDSVLNITDSLIYGNDATRGGGLHLRPTRSQVTVSGTTISGNAASRDGAGAELDPFGSQLTFIDSTISGNSFVANGNGRHYGGGIWFRRGYYFDDPGSTLHILNTELLGNSATIGGAVAAELEPIDELIIEQAEITGNQATLGGGIHVRASRPRNNRIAILESNLVGNSAQDYGGGMVGLFGEDATAEIVDTALIANIAGISGGGALLGSYDGGQVTVQGSTVSGNRAEDAHGGGLDVTVGEESGEFKIERTLFSGNYAESTGAAIYAAVYQSATVDENMMILDSEIINNRSGIDGGGVGLNVNGGRATIRSTSISDNQAIEGSGGGIHAALSHGALNVTDSTIAGNRGYRGGGILIDPSYSEFTTANSTISGNTASRGGGIFSRSGPYSAARILYSTIYGNTARRTDGGGGINIPVQVLAIRHSIVAGNVADEVPNDVGGAASYQYFDFNLFGVGPNDIHGTNLFGTIAAPLDPRLEPLADNGGPTPTHALLEDSPAINAGDPSFTTPPNFDQRGDGFDRVRDNAIDIGAFESGSSSGFVVVDRRADRSFSHDGDGVGEGTSSLDSDNRNPVGVTTTTGSRTWVVDRNDKVYVYDEDGALLGAWEPEEIRAPEGITTNGADIWIVDRSRDRVYFYEDAAQTISGEVTATSSFALSSENRNPMGIAFGIVDGQQRLWVVNDQGATERVFRYRTDGTMDGSWEFDADTNSQPRGIAVNPVSASDVLIVDRRSDIVSRFEDAATTITGNEERDATFVLHSAATDPQGIARPISAPGAPPLRAPSAPLPESHGTQSSRAGRVEIDGLRLRFMADNVANRIVLRPAMSLADLVEEDSVTD